MGNKKFLIFTLFIISNSTWAMIPEKVTCSDEHQVWKVKFDLDGQVATHLSFMKKGKLKKAIPMVKADINQKKNNTCYDFSFGQNKFLNFDRTNGAKKFSAIFILSEEITSNDKIVTCSVE